MKFTMKRNAIALIIISLLLSSNVFSQNNGGYKSAFSDRVNKLMSQDYGRVITTAVPFLLIAPDAKAGSMGDAGVASAPDASSMHWNPAKYAFAEKDMGIAISYAPWLRQLVNDIGLAYLSGYKKIDNMSAIGASLEYFSLGDITFTDNIGNPTGNYRPSEFSFDITYSRKLSKSFSGAVAARYINSNLTLGQYTSGGQETHAGQSVAADVAVYYQKNIKIDKTKALIAFGANISNLGAKISYTSTTQKDFIPANLRIGTSVTMFLDDYNKLTAMIDLNKLLVPTPPIYMPSTSGIQDSIGHDGNKVILSGMDPNVGIVSGMFQSFYDAPLGFKEELREITYSLGLEYWYDNQFAIRAGYFHESMYKGNRQFLTLGAGLKYNVFGLDFAYLIPTEQRNPLQNTLRFTLTFDFDSFNNQNEKAPK